MVLCFSKALAATWQTTRYHKPAGRNINIKSLETFASYVRRILFVVSFNFFYNSSLNLSMRWWSKKSSTSLLTDIINNLPIILSKYFIINIQQTTVLFSAQNGTKIKGAGNSLMCLDINSLWIVSIIVNESLMNYKSLIFCVAFYSNKTQKNIRILNIVLISKIKCVPHFNQGVTNHWYLCQVWHWDLDGTSD
jgi:hypothetical protein